MKIAESADYEDYGKDSVLLRQGAVQLVVSTGPGTRAFLDEHGDGIANVALTCDEVAESRDAAVAAGATVTESRAGLPAGIRIRRHLAYSPAGSGRARKRLPAGRTWITEPGRPAGRIQLLDHIAICVEGPALGEYADFYADALGLARYSIRTSTSVVPRWTRSSSAMSPAAPRSPWWRQGHSEEAGQLEGSLPGITGRASSISPSSSMILFRRSMSRGPGVEFLHSPDAYYEMLAERLPDIRAEIADLRAANVLADRDEWGYLLQMFTRSPYQRNTMFYELYSAGAPAGSDGANIQALYEAVERDGLRG